MKHLKILLLFVIVVFSCNEKDEIDNQNEFSNDSFKLIASFNNSKIGLDEKNVQTHYVNNEVKEKFIFSDYMNKSSKNDFSIVEIDNQTVRIVNNNNTDEYYELTNVINEDNNKNFDLFYSSRNLNISDIKIEFNEESSAKCPWCWVTVAGYIIKAAVEITTESDCQTAINACTEAGGLPTTKIIDGFFSDSCEVTCNPKE